MENKMENKINFLDILSKQKIEIPIIQRDYAQGRENNQVKEIRDNFLEALFDAIEKRIESNTYQLELDFIYGLNVEDTDGFGRLSHRKCLNVEDTDGFGRLSHHKFIPIDGQQRLTTLWLLYWFVSKKEEKTEEKLKNFVYETRYSSTIFCQKLIDFKPSFSKETISKETISEKIKDQSWYFETWDYDPTIKSMLVMLDAIEEKYNKLKMTPIWKII